MLRMNGKEIKKYRVHVIKGEPLQRELAAFIDCASQGSQPRVNGYEAAAALDLALKITRKIEETNRLQIAS